MPSSRGLRVRELRAAAPVLVLLALPGCLGILSGPTGEEALADWRAEARAIDARLDALPSVSGSATRGNAQSNWRAWWEDGDIAAIREQIRLGQGGTRRAASYYEDGDLRYYLAEGQWPEVRPEGGVALIEARREIVFDGGGRDVASRQESDGRVAPVPPAIIVGVRSHAARLARDAARLLPEQAANGGS